MQWRCTSCGHTNRGRDKTCAECGDPKDRSEKYEMPGDTAAAPTITDAKLLRMATAGPDWRCAYCGSDQRRLDGRCAQCGASIDDAVKEPQVRARPLTRWQRLVRWMRKHPVATALIAITTVVLVTIIASVAWANRTRDFRATVADARWTHTITVERYQVWAREGWRADAPAAAFDVKSLGQQVHHYDDVLDGYDTEHYTEQVACGEDCHDVPERCAETCRDNGNGFATCTTTCTGGGRSCRTRYCSEPRTRQVPRYRKEARYAEAIAYHVWDWGDHRTVAASGAGVTGLRWPTDEARTGANLAAREQERERRSARYVVSLAFGERDRLHFETTADAFPTFAVGTSHHLRLKGKTVTVDGQRVERTTP